MLACDKNFRLVVRFGKNMNYAIITNDAEFQVMDSTGKITRAQEAVTEQASVTGAFLELHLH